MMKKHKESVNQTWQTSQKGDLPIGDCQRLALFGTW
jgi:hypothetical protein